jgi:hypothetical protein
MSSFGTRFTAGLVLVPLVTLAAPARTTAATVTDCGDTGGPGQLRASVAAAAPGELVTVPPCTITLSLAAGGELVVDRDLTIQGAGASRTILDGGGVTRVLRVPAGNVFVSGVTIRNGLALDGGGAIVTGAGSLTIGQSAVTGNTAMTSGGGLANFGLDTLNVVQSTVSGNLAGGNGAGGIENLIGTVHVSLSTISGNVSTGNTSGAVGGLASLGGTVRLVNTTVAENTGVQVSGLRVLDGTLTLKNTIVANGAPNCEASGAGTIVSAGHNLENGDTCSLDHTFWLGDLTDTDPLLGPLQNNGGTTPTHAPLPGSPAIDAGDDAVCPEAFGTDQRVQTQRIDFHRPGHNACDIGALEVGTLRWIRASLSVSPPTVSPGGVLQATVSVANEGYDRFVEVYVALVLPSAVGPGVGCPGGDAVAFMIPGGFAATCLSASVQTFAPLLEVGLPHIFVPVSGTLFALAWPTGAPPGPYTVALVMTPRGAFADGRVDPFASMVVATAGFTATE